MCKCEGIRNGNSYVICTYEKGDVDVTDVYVNGKRLFHAEAAANFAASDDELIQMAEAYEEIIEEADRNDGWENVSDGWHI